LAFNRNRQPRKAQVRDVTNIGFGKSPSVGDVLHPGLCVVLVGVDSVRTWGFSDPIASFGPFLAAIVVLALTEGKAGLLGLFRRMVRWRVSPGWYVVALLLPAVLAAAATVLNVMLGAERPSAVELSGWTGLFATFAIRLLIPGFGGAWEEPGWRGYALPYLGQLLLSDVHWS
jgi:hypothetical protein